MTDQDTLALQDLILRTSSSEFAERQPAWRQELVTEYSFASEERQAQIAELLAENAVDMRSVLADWRLKCWENHPHSAECAIVSDETLADLAEENLAQVRAWGRADLAEKAEAEIAAIARSNLAALTRMTFRGEANTFWGNDYAAHLKQAMRRGAALVTTNPVLVNTARKEEPEYWTPVRDALRAKHIHNGLEYVCHRALPLVSPCLTARGVLRCNIDLD